MTKADFAIVQILSAAILTVISIAIAVLMLLQAKRVRSFKLRLQAHLLWSGMCSISAYLFLPAIAYLYTEHLWFQDVGYSNIFWGLLKGRWGLFLKFVAIASVFIGMNFFIGHRICPISTEFARWTRDRTKKFYCLIAFLILFVSVVLAAPMMFFWDDFVRYEKGPRWTGVPETAFQKLLFVVKGELRADLRTGRVTDSLRKEFEKHGMVLSQNADLRSPDFTRKNIKWIITDRSNKKMYSIVEENNNLNLYAPKDLSFFLFEFPIYRMISLWLKVLMWVNFLVTGLLYNFYYRRDPQTMARVDHYLVVHASILWVMLLIVSVWRSQINIWDTLYTSRTPWGVGHVDGLGYVDDHLITATHIYMFCIALVGVVVLINMFWRKRQVWYTAVALWGLSYLLLIQISPLVYYGMRVRPNKYVEAPFVGSHIGATRRAFGLEDIDERDQIKGAATLDTINRNPEIKENIQLWDRRVLYEVLRDQQTIEPYYNFHPYTDVDRYWVNGQYRQVLIAAREIDPTELTEPWDWATRKFIYTHGYGVCVAPVNEFKENSNPNFWVKGIPINYIPDLAVTQPQIYYGELTNDYVIVNTRRPEKSLGGEQYNASGGVKISGWFRRFCFSVRYDFWRMMLSPELTSESRILFWRKIGTRRSDSSRMVVDRISHIAPFLKYDPDPYIVIGDEGGLWWIIDIYVTSRSYPNAKSYIDETELQENPFYSEPVFDRFNYIRNPAVAIVNAYSGEVNFYFTKGDQEPVTLAYSNAFPNLFKSRDSIPAGLQNHLRYPDYLTRIQAEMYAYYHVEDADIFLDGSDKWNIPKEAYYMSHQAMVPYYAILKLPADEMERDDPEFVNMIPFTPPVPRVRLMNAWLVARSDSEHYGQLVVYKLPQEETIDGPTQVEARIETNLSEKLTLWNQQGTTVIRGNLLVIPVENALFYVEPIYLKTDSIERPNLQTVVVAAGDRFAAATTFDKALENIFVGVNVGLEVEVTAENEGQPRLTRDELIKLARDKYNQYLKATGENKISEAAEAFMDLGETLETLVAGKDLRDGEATSNAKR